MNALKSEIRNPKSEIERAAIYRRVSTDHQDGSLALQERRVGEYVAFRRLVTDEGLTFSDPDTSGRTPMRERRGGGALLARLKLGDVKHLVVAKLDRLGRNVRDGMGFLEFLKEQGIVLHIVDFGGETISTQGHMGKMILTVLLAVSEWEVEEIRDRTRKQMRQIFESDGLTGNVPFGYVCHYTLADGSVRRSDRALSAEELALEGPVVRKEEELVAAPAEQAIIRQIHQLRGGGARLSFKAIATVLNQQGSTTKQGRPWQTGSVHSVLHSRHSQRLLAPQDELHTSAEDEEFKEAA